MNFIFLAMRKTKTEDSPDAASHQANPLSQKVKIILSEYTEQFLFLGLSRLLGCISAYRYGFRFLRTTWYPFAYI